MHGNINYCNILNWEEGSRNFLYVRNETFLFIYQNCLFHVQGIQYVNNIYHTLKDLSIFEVIMASENIGFYKKGKVLQLLS